MACVVKRRGKYVLDYYDQTGKRRWETTDGNKKDAELLLAQRVQEVARGDYQSRADQTTFEQLTEAYLTNRVKGQVRKPTAEDYEETIRRHILPHFAGRRVRSISMHDVEQFRAHMTKKGEQGALAKGADMRLRKFGPSTVNKCLTLLSMMFNYALAHKWVTTNPAASVKKIKTGKRREDESAGKVLEAEDVQLVLDAADSQWRLVIKMAIYTGLRESELMGLKWSDIDLQAGDVQVSRSYRLGQFDDTKTKSSWRRVPIPGSLLTELKTWSNACPKGEHDLVFPNGSGNPENPSNLLNRGFYPALRRAGVRRIRFHDLRHTYASQLIENGESPKVVQSLLGHASIQVTFDTYGHLFKGSTQGVAERLEQSFGSKMVAEADECDTEAPQLVDVIGRACRGRTCDQLIKSQLLYQLS